MEAAATSVQYKNAKKNKGGNIAKFNADSNVFHFEHWWENCLMYYLSNDNALKFTYFRFVYIICKPNIEKEIEHA